MQLKEVKIYWNGIENGQLAWHYFKDEKGMIQGRETTYHEDGRLFYTTLTKDGKAYGPFIKQSRDKTEYRFYKNNTNPTNRFGQQKIWK